MVQALNLKCLGGRGIKQTTSHSQTERHIEQLTKLKQETIRILWHNWSWSGIWTYSNDLMLVSSTLAGNSLHFAYTRSILDICIKLNQADMRYFDQKNSGNSLVSPRSCLYLKVFICIPSFLWVFSNFLCKIAISLPSYTQIQLLFFILCLIFIKPLANKHTVNYIYL